MNHGDANTVVVAIDGTSGSDGALRYSAEQARTRGLDLKLVHVGPRYEVFAPVLPYIPQEVDVTGQSILHQTQRLVTHLALAPDVSCTTELRHGSRIFEIIDSARSAHSLVVGRETHAGLARVLLGATTAAVVARATVPTSVIPDGWKAGAAHQQVVIGIRDTKDADTLLEAAFAYAHTHNATLDVVHAWKIPDPYIDALQNLYHSTTWVKAGTDIMNQALAPWRERYPEVATTTQVLHAEPASALLNAAEGADQLILLRRPVPKLVGPHLGKTARTIISAAPCPVTVLPSPHHDHTELDLELERSGELLR